jgi:hypothetical protein
MIKINYKLVKIKEVKEIIKRLVVLIKEAEICKPLKLQKPIEIDLVEQ